jgi:hypothetical protein
MVGIRSPDGLVVGLAPDILEFWVRFPNERNRGKQGTTLCYVKVPGSSRVPPHANNFIKGTVVINTHRDVVVVCSCYICWILLVIVRYFLLGWCALRVLSSLSFANSWSVGVGLPRRM